jgi:hypothetical protein
MLRHILILALLAAPEAALARPVSAAPKPAEAVAVSAPVCTHVRRKAFRPVEGWSVKTVSLVCKTVTAALRQPGTKSFTSLESARTGPRR